MKSWLNRYKTYKVIKEDGDKGSKIWVQMDKNKDYYNSKKENSLSRS